MLFSLFVVKISGYKKLAFNRLLRPSSVCKHLERVALTASQDGSGSIAIVIFDDKITQNAVVEIQSVLLMTDFATHMQVFCVLLLQILVALLIGNEFCKQIFNLLFKYQRACLIC